MISSVKCLNFVSMLSNRSQFADDFNPIKRKRGGCDFYEYSQPKCLKARCDSDMFMVVLKTESLTNQRLRYVELSE